MYYTNHPVYFSVFKNFWEAGGRGCELREETFYNLWNLYGAEQYGIYERERKAHQIHIKPQIQQYET